MSADLVYLQLPITSILKLTVVLCYSCNVKKKLYKCLLNSAKQILNILVKSYRKFIVKFI